MTIGTMFTLFVTPAIYTLIAREHSKARAEAPSPAPVWTSRNKSASDDKVLN